tara:strand:+ start:47 stop:1063 length:1017 start_codon:yes stop_codon:yes gene_type:complete
MDYLKGENLFEELKYRNQRHILFNEVYISKLMKTVLSTVNYLHEDRRIIHGNIKAENFVFASNSSFLDIVLTDFGHSTFMKDNQLNYDKIASVPHRAPEVRNGEGFNHLSDSWSLGYLTYEMLSGLQPTFDLDYHPIFYQDMFSDVSFQALNFIERLLSKDISQRMSVKEALHHDFITKYSVQSNNESLLLKPSTDRWQNNITCIILAGEGTEKRIGSGKVVAKALIEIAGMPILRHILITLKNIGIMNIVIVIREEHRNAYENELSNIFEGASMDWLNNIRLVHQPNPLGTADALKQALPFIHTESTLILPCDAPFIPEELLTIVATKVDKLNIVTK